MTKTLHGSKHEATPGNTRQHEATRVKHEETRVKHEATRVKINYFLQFVQICNKKIKKKLKEDYLRLSHFQPQLLSQ